MILFVNRVNYQELWSTGYIDGLVQDYNISIANALEILQSWIKVPVSKCDRTVIGINFVHKIERRVCRQALNYILVLTQLYSAICCHYATNKWKIISLKFANLNVSNKYSSNDSS